MLKKLSVAAALALCLGVVPMFGHASFPPEGCAAGGGLPPQGNGTLMAEDGGLVVAGDGVVTVTHADSSVTTYSNAVHAVGDGAVVIGDTVSCSATTGIAAAGNPNP